MEQEKKIVYLNVDDILPNRFQPRIKFEEESLTELTDSIKEHGVIQPITVRPLGDKYEIIAGERRYKASLLAGKTTIPAIIVELNDKDSAEIALIENVQRKDLTPIEEAISYKKILDMNYVNQEQLAAKLGKTQSTIANKLRLLNLSDEVQEALLDGKISERHARSLLRLENKQNQNTMLKRIIEERLTVRRTDEEIDKMNQGNDIEIMDFDLDPTPTTPTPTSPVMEVDPKTGIGEIEDTHSKNDEEMDKFYNIPTTPIIEDQEEAIGQPTDINPGFMNVEKIEKEADDINKEKPIANIEELLKSPVGITNPIEANLEPVPPVEPEEEEPKFRQGRFFTMLDPEEDTEDAKPTFEEQPANKKPSLLDQLNSDAKVITSDGMSSMNTPSTPQATNDAFASFNTMPETIENPVPSVTPVPTVEQLEKEQAKTEPFDPNTVFAFTPEETTIESSPVEVPPTDVKEEPPVVEPTATAHYGADLKTVINTIRNCSDTIEKYGYVVDMEEFDFEDMYQVIFKVQKKNK